MHLMNITLQEGGAITDAVYGNFCGTKSQDIVCSGGTSIRLLQTQSPSEAGGVLKQLQTIHSQQVFGVVRSLMPFRLTGGTKDYLVVGTDSGKITVLEYMVDLSRWEVRHSETFGKTGCRRITPGQYLATDPKGRAIMVGAVEKQKLVYIMNRDASNRLTISSPLEAHRSHAIHFDMVGVDVGFENPIFAILEVDYSEHDDGSLDASEAVKSLVYYELDLGLNHVTRRWSEPVMRSANKLIAVPGGTDGPGGVLVCSEGWIVYKNERHPEVPCRIPQRARPVNTNVDVRSEVLIVASATHKQRDLFFIIVQSELGDLYKVTLTYTNDEVSAVKVKFFDTLPPAVALCITKTGYLFAASEASKHYLLQFQSIGDNDSTAEAHSFQEYVPSFSLRRLTNLALVESLDSLAPITQLLVDDLANEHTPQMYGSESVEEVTNTGLTKEVGSLLVGLLADDSIVQIHRQGFNHVRQYHGVMQFKAPGKKVIEKCSANARQVVLSMAGGTLIYFELNAAGELAEVGRTETLGEISSLDIGPVPEGRQRFPFLAVGSYDGNVRILNLDPNNLFADQTLLALPGSHPHSLCFAQLQHEPHADALGGHALFLSIGYGRVDGTKGTQAGQLRVYRLVEGTSMVLVHTTELDGIPYAMCEFQGRLLVSVGKILRIYDLGKKKMLRKCENRNFPSTLVKLTTAGARIYASDNHHSFHFVRYRADDNQLVIFADDFVPRCISASTLVDYDTMAGGDKFGNVFVARLPSEVSDEVENPTGNRMLWDAHLLNGAPNKVEQVCQFYVGETITSMVRTRLVPVGKEAIVYTTVMGRIGALIPFSSRVDVDFATHLEMSVCLPIFWIFTRACCRYMRQEAPPLCGRDHLSFRSYFIPVKDVADGDLCDQFGMLSAEKQLKIAHDMDQTPMEVLKKLEDIRNGLL
ncbi:hypothetical protein DYB32_004815 [Aphanomyces invadans]|uniref:DNA damage-binding protein 1 n=1 Tax=Aphanomyces invadans TaxID=157072 RepID=A0A3R7D0P6_9STRA|nr:hypothetical protein DYB32_004815 [Aphanomyces invadans]